MGMSTHVLGIKPPDETWQKMKAVYDACAAAKIPAPQEVLRFFDHQKPDSAGVTVSLEQHAAVTRWRDDSRQGFEVDLSKLDPAIRVLRFYNAW